MSHSNIVHLESNKPSQPGTPSRPLLVHSAWRAKRSAREAAAASSPSRDAAAARDLTPRELEILRHVARGWSNREVGDHLGIAEATVRTHVLKVFSKMGVRNRVEMTLQALRRGFATLEECLGIEPRESQAEG